MKAFSTNARRCLTRLGMAAVTAGFGWALVRASGTSSGGIYVLSGQTVSSGWRTTGGSFRLNGAVRAPAGVSFGEDYIFSGGALEHLEASVGEFSLAIVLTPAGQAFITWPAEAEGFLLESTPELGPGADWQPVHPLQAPNQFLTEPSAGQRFYRLHKP